MGTLGISALGFPTYAVFSANRTPTVAAGATFLHSSRAVSGVSFNRFSTSVILTIVQNFGAYDRIYGSFGAAVGFLTWIWNSLMIFLGCAELDRD